MEPLIEFAMFTGKVSILVIAFAIVIALIAAQAIKAKPSSEELELEDLNERYKTYAHALQASLFTAKERKLMLKTEKKEDKKKAKSPDKGKHAFVLDFDGDIKASAVHQLREEISAILTVAQPEDEVVLRLESPGGMVHSYGLAAAQLLRIKKKGLKLTICVDKVAASGGYMMACTADQIIAAPFAILGSVGVLAQIPNFNRLLKKHDVDYQEITAGEYKRTLSLFGEVTDKGKQKFTEQIEDTHLLFKTFVLNHRPQLDLNKIATGEHWYGQQALELNLIDRIQTSDDYLFSLKEDFKLILVKLKKRQKLADKISGAIGKISLQALQTLQKENQESRFS